MNKHLSNLIVVSLLLVCVSGCGLVSRMQKTVSESDRSKPSGNSQILETKDKSLTDKAIETTVGDEKIGVPECDDLIEYFAEQSKTEDENYLTKATRQYFMNKIRESFKQSIEENKGDKVKMAKECKDYRRQLDKFKAEEDSKKQ